MQGQGCVEEEDRYIRRFIDNHGRVPGAHSIRRLARTVGRFDHGRSAGGNREVADGHQFLRQRDAGLLNTLHDVFRRALLRESRTQNTRRLERGACLPDADL